MRFTIFTILFMTVVSGVSHLYNLKFLSEYSLLVALYALLQLFLNKDVEDMMIARVKSGFMIGLVFATLSSIF